MPELPEVETIRLDLEAKLKGKKIVKVTIMPDPRGSRLLRRYPSARKFSRRLRKRRILKIDRRGKYLLLRLDLQEALIIHLGMTGRLLYQRQDSPLGDYTRAVFCLDNGRELRFCDSRKFGELYLFSPAGKDVAVSPDALGPEPLSREFTAKSLGRIIGGRKKPIKALLMDQKLIAGIGNIYSDEALFISGIHPLTPSSALSPAQIGKLHRAVRKILRAAIKSRGTTSSDYRDGFGKKGNFQRRLKVYQREGEPCYRCGTPIKAVKLQGRTSCFCPRCQR